ncbi:MAG: DUF3783 domain-containing protein [Desulfovibrio sp.]
MGNFTAVEQDSDRRMYGPRAMLVCGYAPAEQQLVLDTLRKELFKDIVVVFADQECMSTPLHDLFGQKHCYKIGKKSPIPRAMILSGITEKELHTIMALHKSMQLPKQLWATLTPTAETWQLGDLLIELNKEHRAMKARRAAAKASDNE